jgi:hypothetical protein
VVGKGGRQCSIGRLVAIPLDEEEEEVGTLHQTRKGSALRCEMVGSRMKRLPKRRPERGDGKGGEGVLTAAAARKGLGAAGPAPVLAAIKFGRSVDRPAREGGWGWSGQIDR